MGRGGEHPQVVAAAAARVEGVGLQQCPTVRAGSASLPYGTPSKVAAPAVGRVRPSSARRVVDFPAPLRPRKPVTDPAGTAKLSSSTAVVAP
jgi:hypothetical protein